MSAPSLPFTLEGAEQDGGAVMFNDFRGFLQTLSDCLTVVEKRVLGTAELRHRIADMKSGSAHMTLEPVPKKTQRPDSGRLVYETFEKTVSAIEEGKNIDPRFGKEDLKQFRKLATLTLGGKKRVQIAGVQLSTQFVATIDKLLGGTTRARGTVKGRVERLNVHNRSEFTLYPPVGDYSIACTFPEDAFDKVQKAIKQNVTVHGLLAYRTDSPYPERVQVESIEVHPPDESLPKLADLRGLFPDATGDKTVIEFIQAIRDE